MQVQPDHRAQGSETLRRRLQGSYHQLGDRVEEQHTVIRDTAKDDQDRCGHAVL
jgi:hypothetical protein